MGEKIPLLEQGGWAEPSGLLSHSILIVFSLYQYENLQPFCGCPARNGNENIMQLFQINLHGVGTWMKRFGLLLGSLNLQNVSSHTHDAPRWTLFINTALFGHVCHHCSRNACCPLARLVMIWISCPILCAQLFLSTHLSWSYTDTHIHTPTSVFYLPPSQLMRPSGSAHQCGL